MCQSYQEVGENHSKLRCVMALISLCYIAVQCLLKEFATIYNFTFMYKAFAIGTKH
jgi:hypothetical protein